MEHATKNTIRARLMLARVYAGQGWLELARVQLQLIRKERTRFVIVRAA